MGRGIDKRTPVSLIVYSDLEAVMSEVPLKEFASEEIERRASEDLRWIKEKAELHEKIIEKAMGKKKKISVIPMKFGTIFKTIEGLNSTLKKNYLKFKKILKRLKDKQEWSVKVYLRSPEALREEIKNRNPEVQSLQASLNSLPEGIAYFKEKEIEELINSKLKEILDTHKELFFSNLKKYAVSSNRGKILEKELTGHSYPMVLNAIFLVPGPRIGDFKNRLKELSQEAGPKGFYFEYSGPWPPYNFI